MSKIYGWFMLIVGIGLAVVALQGLVRGWLPNGSKGYRRGEGVSRGRQPIGFWLMFCVYMGGGLYAVLFGLRVLIGLGDS